MKLRHGLALISFGLAACAVHSLPPGTPPPEYEAPSVVTWSIDHPDAGAEVDSAVDGGPLSDLPPGAELSPDASVR